MTVTAPGPVSAVAQLIKLAALPLPQAGTATTSIRAPDQFVQTPPPTLEALLQLAAAGQHNLATLLPALQRMLIANPAPLPLGHLSRAIGDAAHWIDAGAAGLLATDTTGLTPAWRQITRMALHDAADLLTHAEQHLGAIPQPFPNPDLLWAMGQVAGARSQIGLALGTLAARTRPSTIPTFQPPGINRAIALYGLALMLVMLALAYGTWLTIAALVGTIAAFAWIWRIVMLSRHLKLEIRR